MHNAKATVFVELSGWRAENAPPVACAAVALEELAPEFVRDAGQVVW